MTKRPSHSSCLALALRQVKLLCLIAWGFLKALGRAGSGMRSGRCIAGWKAARVEPLGHFKSCPTAGKRDVILHRARRKQPG